MKSHMEPLGANPLLQTLELLQDAADERVVAWGAQYDWTQPVVVTFVGGKATSETAEQAGALLVRFNDARLAKLLLRGDMFDAAGQALQLVASKSARNSVTPDGLSFRGDQLWAGVFIEACVLGEKQLIERVANFWPKAGNPDPSVLSALAKQLAQSPWPKREQALTLLLEPGENNVFCSWLTYFRHTTEQAEFMSKLAMRVPVSEVEQTLGLFGKILSKRVLKSQLAGKLAGEGNRQRVERAFAIARAGRAVNGYFDDGSDPSHWVIAELAQFLCKTELAGDVFQPLAAELLAWQAELGSLGEGMTSLLEILAWERGGLWDERVVAAIRKVKPHPEARELAGLIMAGSDETVQDRMSDFVAGPPWRQHPPGGLIEAIAASVKHQAKPPGRVNYPLLIERCLQLASQMAPVHGEAFVSRLQGEIIERAAHSIPKDELIAAISQWILDHTSAQRPKQGRVRL